MASKKQKERKKKKREEIARKRVLRRREAFRRQKKQSMQEKISEMEAEEKAFGKMKPFVKNDASVLNDALKEIRDKDKEIHSRIEHNLKILEALEEEYDKENAARKEINQKLENEGYMTIKDKMDALHKKALELEGISKQMEEAQKEFDEQKDDILVEPQVVEPDPSGPDSQ